MTFQPRTFQSQTFQPWTFQPHGSKIHGWKVRGWKVHGWKVWGWEVQFNRNDDFTIQQNHRITKTDIVHFYAYIYAVHTYLNDNFKAHVNSTSSACLSSNCVKEKIESQMRLELFFFNDLKSSSSKKDMEVSSVW